MGARKVDEQGLTIKQAKFVKLVVEQNKTYDEAYIIAYETDETNKTRINNAAKRIRYKPKVSAALKRGLSQINVEVALWTKELSIKKLRKLLDKAEEDLDSRGISKTNSDTILGTIKELNTMTGLNFKDQKRYEIDLANVELSRMRYELDKSRIEGPDEDELEDDGFLEAIKLEARTVWEDEE